MNKRDMSRVIEPLGKIGCFFYPKKKMTLPLTIEGTSMPLAQKHIESIGSAQIKSLILLSALSTPGVTTIEEKKISRNHTELLFKYLKIPIKIKKINNFEIIKITKIKIEIYIYPRTQCASLDLADVELQQTSMFSSLNIEKVNIRTSTELYHLYGARIPVLKRADNEKEIGWPFNTADLEEFLQ